jgi:hypothetical protein
MRCRHRHFADDESATTSFRLPLASVMRQIPDSVIADTAAAVFAADEFARARPSLLERGYSWLRDFLAPAREATAESGLLYWSLIAGAILVLLVIGRATYLARMRETLRASEAGNGRTSTGKSRGGDPWRAAEDLAASGEFTDAAHSLYLALLDAVARRERLRLHPAFTVGDYVRALRARSSSLFARFREFASSYETVVYGLGVCDRERYERLRSLALPIVQGDG